MNSVGGVNASMSGMTITGGVDSTFGGAGILAGSGNALTTDVMTMDSVIVTGNQANAAQQSVTNAFGGGMQFSGGQLTVTNSTFNNNGAFSSPGSGLAYFATGAGSPESLTVSGTTFSANHATNSSGVVNGGALALFGSTSSATVTNSRFVNNTVVSTNGPAIGAAINVQAGTLNLTGSTFTGNSVTGGTGQLGGAVYATGTSATLHHNRFTGNVATTASALALAGGTADAASNWWGCNTGPGTAGCDTVSGSPIVAPRLVLTASASPSTVTGPNATSTITAALTTDSLGGPVGGVNLGAFEAHPVTFSDPPGDATVTTTPGPHTAVFTSGQATIDYHSNTTVGADPVNVTLDNATVSTTVNVNQAPAITSANTANFNVGSAGSFTVTTTGFPTPAITETGTLPAGLTFVDNGDGTATLSGTATSGGTFPLTITANNGVSPNATQTLTLTVGQPPAFTSASTATFVIGTAGSLTVTTSGIPTVTAITETGTLPAGVSFADNGDGTATISGTPTGTGATYPVTLTATNGVAPNGTQALTIQVNQAPAVTTNPSDQTVNPGTSVTFTAAASGVPTPAVQWQRSTNGGTSYSDIAGATSTSYTFTAIAADDGNMYRAVFTNLVSSATTTGATLRVGTTPAFTSSDITTFAVGAPGTFTITTSGVPNATISTSSTLPAWLTLSDHGDGTATLAGTPPSGSGASYPLALAASNGFHPPASQNFTLIVNESPAITSADHATFTAGSAGTFAVTTNAGFPTATTLTETGALPSGVTFVDNGNGTATLAGTPAAGTGGMHAITITAGNGAAPNATQSFTLTVNEAPSITSADHATFTVGTPGSFTVTTGSAFPADPAITHSAGLPTAITLVDNGNGTATLSGTPVATQGGVHPITITASNGVSPNATQTFTLTVNEPPTITSANHATFTLGAAAGFTVTTSPGQPPTPITLSAPSGDLPPGVTFTDNGDGTATIGGTPTSAGAFPFVITASNGVAPDTTQTFTATVNKSPTFTSADHATFPAGTAGTFTVTTAPGVPAATALSETGTLPTGVTFTDNGDGTATLAGTPAAGTGGNYPLTVTAAAVGGTSTPTTQTFTLTVTELPAITSANSTAFTVGTQGAFTVTTTAGFPTATTLTQTGTLPTGVTFTDTADGTATIAGTPAAAIGGSYPLTITATNTAGSVNQSFTLTIRESPVITSVDTTTFTAGTNGTFTVTTAGGFPTPPSLSEAGTLPDGVTFADQHDGTAILSGQATAGGVYPILITASNSVTTDAQQTFTLTVNGPPSITSTDHMTFTAGLAGSFTVTTAPGVPAATALTETGDLPTSVTFVDNGDGTATIAGTAPLSAVGLFSLTITASNGIAPDATQSLTLEILQSGAVSLSSKAPASDGLLQGVPPATTVGTTLHLSGGGYAAGAPVVIGIYSAPTTLATTTADDTGNFTVDVQVPNKLGSHVFIAAGLGADGAARYLEARTVIKPPPAHVPAGGSSGSSGSLSRTGPDTDLVTTLGWAAGLLLGGLVLLVGARRIRRG